MPATIFSGTKVKALKSTLDLNGESVISSGSVDPSAVATDGNPGSLYLNSSTGNVYRKTDSGSSTNWSLVNQTNVNRAVNTYSSNTTLTTSNSIVLVNAASGSVTITLPTPTSGIILDIKKIDSSTNGVTISAPSGTIDGTSTQLLNIQYQSLTITSNGTNFYII